MAIINTLYKEKAIKQLAMLLATCAMLFACNPPPPDPICVGSDDMGITSNKNITVDSTTGKPGSGTEWVNTHLVVEQGKKLSIRSQGSVYLCLGDQQLEEESSFTPSSTNPEWQDSGIIIKTGYKYKFEVTGQYTLWSSVPDSCGGKYLDSSCYLRNGKGLFAFIGNGTPQDAWFGTENQDDDDAVFEMYRRDEEPGKAGYSTDGMRKEGKLWFRYRDSEGSLENSFTAKSAYGDNQGSYTIKVKRYGTCYGTNGHFLKAKIIPVGSAATVTGNPIPIENCWNSSSAPATDPAADVCNNGLYSTLNAPGSGEVLLRIDDNNTPDSFGIKHGDGDYSHFVPKGTFIPASGNTPAKTTTVDTGSNSGLYSVGLTTVKADDSKFSSLVNAVVGPVRKILYGTKASDAVPATSSTPAIPAVAGKPGITEAMYKGITFNGDFIQGVRALMVLYIVFFALSFMLGTLKITNKELMHVVIKLSIVITMISPTSWEFFNKYLFAFFIEGTDSLIYIMANNINNLITGVETPLMVNGVAQTGAANADSVFGFLNSTFAILFSQEANIKLSALLATFPIGTFLAAIMYIGIIFFLLALVKALLAYLISIIMVALLLFMAPIFICFILFKTTKPIFDKWIKQLTSYAMQPVLLFMVLAIFNVFIIMSLYSILNYSACYTCLFTINLPMSEILGKALPFANIQNFDEFCLMHGYLPWGIDSSQDTATRLAKTPAGLFYILIFIILANIMLHFIEWVVNLTANLTGGSSNVNVGVNKAVGSATDMAKSAGNMSLDTAKFAGRNAASGLNKVDNFLGATDAIKKAVRSTVLGGALSKGGTDEMGNKLAVSRSMMTAGEKKGHDRMLNEFHKLSDEDQKSVKNRNIDMRQIDKIKDAGENSRTRLANSETDYTPAKSSIAAGSQAAFMQNLAAYGKTSGLFTRSNKKTAMKNIKENFKLAEGYGKVTGNKKDDTARRSNIRQATLDAHESQTARRQEADAAQKKHGNFFTSGESRLKEEENTMKNKSSWEQYAIKPKDDNSEADGKKQERKDLENKKPIEPTKPETDDKS